jgi:hypothetical protein
LLSVAGSGEEFLLRDDSDIEFMNEGDHTSAGHVHSQKAFGEADPEEGDAFTAFIEKRFVTHSRLWNSGPSCLCVLALSVALVVWEEEREKQRVCVSESE